MCKTQSILVESNSQKKFEFAAKLMHELLANVQEDFKQFCKNKNLDFMHIFQIRRIDRNTKKLEIKFAT